MKTSLLFAFLVPLAFVCSGLSAAPAPQLREKSTFYEMLFDFKKQHEAWWAGMPESQRTPIRNTWWRDATKNQFHDVIEVSHPGYFLELALDSSDNYRANNFGEFFPWFRNENVERIERNLIKRRIERLKTEVLSDDDPLRSQLDELLAELPGGESASPERMALWANLVDYSILDEYAGKLNMILTYGREIWQSELRSELASKNLNDRVNRLQTAIDQRQEELLRLIEGGAKPTPPPQLREGVTELGREIAALRIRLEGVEEVLFAQRTSARGPHWYESFGYWCDNYSENLSDWNVQKSGRLVRLNLRDLSENAILEDPEGSFRDPCVHFSGEKILFSYRPAGEYHNHLYEVNVDGTGMRQLTDGPDDDIEAIYLPDGDLVFCSSRSRRWVPCLNAQVATLHKSDPNGDNIRMLTSNVETENTPWVMPDGRLLFMRWEYVERDRAHPHGLWTINPDGTGIMTYWGNMNEGDVFIDAKPIPGTDEVIFIRHPHGSGEHVGTIARLNPNDGPDEKGSIHNISEYVRLDRKRGYRDPWPLAMGVYLACQDNRLYLMNDDGDRLLLHSVKEGWIHEPRVMGPQPKPPVIPSRVDLSQTTGQMVLADVTHGRHLGEVDYNEVDHLLLLEVLPKPVHHTGHTENLSYNGNFFLERVLGRVPVEEDGSAYFEVPALRNIFMVAVDKEGKSIKRMQSFVTVQPGEIVSCVGCHENRTHTSPRTTDLAALKRPPSQIEKPEGVPDIFHFPRDVQPILDKHCVECHDNENPAANVVLNGDLDPWFNQAYVTIRMREGLISAGFGGVGNTGNLDPRSLGAGHSEIYQLMKNGHQGVELSEQELEKIYWWIESWAQYSGTFAFLNKDGDIRMPVDMKLTNNHCGSCHGRGKWSGFHNQNGAPPVRSDKRETMGLRVNVSHPEQSRMLRAPLSVEAGGLGLCRERKAVSRPEALKGEKNWLNLEADPPANVFTSTDDPVYQEMLAQIKAYAEENLAKRRMEKPNTVPHHDWVREMKRNGVLEEDFTPEGKDLQFYFDVDERYYRSFWHRPEPSGTVSGIQPEAHPSYRAN
ncbi:MAG: hypothetical protein ACFB21_15585 [Opitutales bacterium]